MIDMSLISSMVVFCRSAQLASSEKWVYKEDHAGQTRIEELHLPQNMNEFPLLSTTSTERIR